ncbi:MAG: excinuclease ABC subunit UvrC [Firmicutes bacterium]|jgi:excinuclease ABC subunit C|nr:excinuclease ABC subunit UvrC [Bacillota bacterium]MDH7495263.1 excinuclease ABC subunit UvrC [Bacillota bacterium]
MNHDSEDGYAISTGSPGSGGSDSAGWDREANVENKRAAARERLRERAKDLPDRPGVYLMKDATGRVIYVGKASSLRNRVRSYFQSPKTFARRTRLLVGNIADFEYLVTDSEVEALILENNLIKQHRPRYNVRLRDDKTYPHIKITLAEPFPRVLVTRRVEQDGSRYFGPYPDVSGMRSTLAFIKRLFPVRGCSKRIAESSRERPCLNHHIGRCLAPCAGAITREAYAELVKQIVLFLEGRQDQLVREMKRQMQAASTLMDFETAAALRDRIRAMERVMERQKVVLSSHRDMDVIGFARDEDGAEACVEVFFVRGGKLVGRERFFMANSDDTPDSEMLAAFLKQHYAAAAHVPAEILVQSSLGDEAGSIASWLGMLSGSKVRITSPRRGEKRSLVEMVQANAKLGLEEARIRAARAADMEEGAMAELQQALGLPRLPRRIEAFDISTIQGADAVGSMVVFESGRPLKSAYRRFRIKTVKGQDDFAMMREIVTRRCRRLGVSREEGRGTPAARGRTSGGHEGPESQECGEAAQVLDARGRQRRVSEKDPSSVTVPGAPGVLPDLMLIDGGKGQLNAALEALRQCGLDEAIPAVGLAKEHELVFLKDKPCPISLPRDSKALFLLQRVRDEAHRFAVSYHRQLRTKRATLSALEDVPGIGRKRLKSLITAFRTVEAIREASVEDLAKAPGMTRKAAERVKEALSSLPRPSVDSSD